MKIAEKITKMISSNKTGEEETEVAISFGVLKYCSGVASILKPQAVYNPKSATIRNESNATIIKV